MAFPGCRDLKSVCKVDINSEVYLSSQPENQNVLYSSNSYAADISKGRAMIHIKTAHKTVAVLLVRDRVYKGPFEKVELLASLKRVPSSCFQMLQKTMYLEFKDTSCV